MWVFTKDGFFSVVQKQGQPDDSLTIRSRLRRDILNFKRIMCVDAMVEEDAGTDYAFRIIISRQTWQDYLARVSSDLHYPNFKQMMRKHRPDLHHSLSNVWKVMYDLDGL